MTCESRECLVELCLLLDIEGTVYHLAIYMQSNEIHNVFND